jgi:hypothetical protein
VQGGTRLEGEDGFWEKAELFFEKKSQKTFVLG